MSLSLAERRLLGTIVVNSYDCRVYRGDRCVQPTAVEFRAFRTIWQGHGRVVLHEALGVSATYRKVLMCRVRKLCEPLGIEIVATRRAGYSLRMFNALITKEERSAAADGTSPPQNLSA